MTTTTTPTTTPTKVPVATYPHPLITEAIITAYGAGDAKVKASIRTAVTAYRDAAIDALDITLAKMAKGLLADLVTARPSASKVNYAAVIGARIATLRRAADMIESGAIMPDGITAEMINEGAWSFDTIDADHADKIESAARAMAGSKITKTTDRRDVGEWITRAFDGVAEGTFYTVAQIVTRGIPSDDDGYRPTTGAVTARLKGGKEGCTVPGVTGDDSHNAYGGRKINA